jgi:hypothetical protein
MIQSRRLGFAPHVCEPQEAAKPLFEISGNYSAGNKVEASDQVRRIDLCCRKISIVKNARNLVVGF